MTKEQFIQKYPHISNIILNNYSLSLKVLKMARSRNIIRIKSLDHIVSNTIVEQAFYNFSIMSADCDHAILDNIFDYVIDEIFDLMAYSLMISLEQINNKEKLKDIIINDIKNFIGAKIEKDSIKEMMKEYFLLFGTNRLCFLIAHPLDNFIAWCNTDIGFDDYDSANSIYLGFVKLLNN